MIPPRAHVGLYKALISLIVVGLCAERVANFLLTFLYAVLDRRGPVEGTRGGVFDSVWIGVHKAIEDGLLDRPPAWIASVALVAAIALLFYPVPKVLQSVFDGKLP